MENMVNVPLPAGSDGVRVRAVVDELWMPRLEAFKPQMIFISAGFDAHREDDIGQMSLVEADYVYITAAPHGGGAAPLRRGASSVRSKAATT